MQGMEEQGVGRGEQNLDGKVWERWILKII